MKYIAIFGMGFVLGIVYSSAKYGKDPAIIFAGWKDQLKKQIVYLRRG